MNKSGLDKRKMSFGECEDHRRQTNNLSNKLWKKIQKNNKKRELTNRNKNKATLLFGLKTVFGGCVKQRHKSVCVV